MQKGILRSGVSIILIIPLLLTLVISCSQNQQNKTELKSQKENMETKSENETEVSLEFANEDFYTNGKFNVEKGKDAIIKLMEYHKYPVYEGIREKIWVSDYGTGDFAKIGLALVIWTDDKSDNYLLMDMFLLPNQMLPEHSHIAQEDGTVPKAESWFVKNGLSYIVGMGENNLEDFSIKVPQSHDNGTVEATNVIETKEGGVVRLKNPEKSPNHWQMAGPEGAIITEVASNHSLEHVVYRAKKLNDFILGL